MANQPESNDSSLFPKSDEREDSGLQDILAVAAKIKDGPQEGLAESGSEREDSGMILFSAGALSGGEGKSDDGALFGSFAGGLGAGFGAPVEPISSPDLVPFGGEGSVSETGSPLDARAKPVEEPKRNPLTALAVVLGLGLVAAGAVYLFSEDKGNTQNQQVQAEMSAKPDSEAAVGKAEPTPDEQPGASAGEVVEPQPDPEPVVEPPGETEGALLDGEGGDGLLAAAEGDADDPMAQEQGLLDGGSNPVAKSGKWDQGTSSSKPASEPVAADPKPKPEPEPIVAPIPEPEPAKTPVGGGGGDDEVDCLLNPDLPKCNTGGSSKPKTEEVLAPKLPDKLDSNALRSGFNTVKSKAKACGSKFGAAGGTKVKIHASIDGASGKVSSVEAKGEHAGTDLGKCVEDAVKGATFEKFKKPSQGVDYSMIM